MRPSPTTTARRLAQAIERAARFRLAAHADRLAVSAARLMMHSPRLTECIARLRLAEGNAETALSIIEGSRFRTDSLRFLRAVCLIELGRKLEAEMDLLEWVRAAAAPAEARRLYALIQTSSQRGESCAAEHSAMQDGRDTLMRSVLEDEDARSIELLMIDAVAKGRDDEAAQWALRLVSASKWCATSVQPALLMESLEVEAEETRGAERPAEREIAMLAMEIGAREDLVPVLVGAQHTAFDPFVSSLFYAAMERALPEFTNEAAACESLARLAMVMDRRDDAERWVCRGLECNPMSASLALLAAEIGLDETEREGVSVRRAA